MVLKLLWEALLCFWTTAKTDLDWRKNAMAVLVGDLDASCGASFWMPESFCQENSRVLWTSAFLPAFGGRSCGPKNWCLRLLGSLDGPELGHEKDTSYSRVGSRENYKTPLYLGLYYKLQVPVDFPWNQSIQTANAKTWSLNLISDEFLHLGSI